MIRLDKSQNATLFMNATQGGPVMEEEIKDDRGKTIKLSYHPCEDYWEIVQKIEEK